MRTTKQIKLDIDKQLTGNEFNEKLSNIYNLLEVEKKLKIEQIRAYLSASGKGFHFEVDLCDFVSIPLAFILRTKLGDCENRLIFSIQDTIDEPNTQNYDVLFSFKKYRNDWKQRTLIETINHDGRTIYYNTVIAGMVWHGCEK